MQAPVLPAETTPAALPSLTASIAKRIEEGLRHMIQAISACPTTVHEILDLAEKVEKEELRIDEVVGGLIDPNAKDDFDPKKAEAAEEEEADGDHRLLLLAHEEVAEGAGADGVLADSAAGTTIGIGGSAAFFTAKAGRSAL